ncbi:hypothetical protein L195_g058364 [Trifolium pratense]|uniref:Uncharacterized protein n=1 Tax=Trifolium pratense TaxID=57577 RepID=A0A2K3JRU2_TRIPR|nr:hypothetical protein L195_g058364 [Trifolium pratense]
MTMLHYAEGVKKTKRGVIVEDWNPEFIWRPRAAWEVMPRSVVGQGATTRSVMDLTCGVVAICI